MINLDGVTNSAIAHVIDEYVHSSRDREILKDRYINGMCYEPLSEKYDVSVTTIKNIIYKNENRIFKHLRV